MKFYLSPAMIPIGCIFAVNSAQNPQGRGVFLKHQSLSGRRGSYERMGIVVKILEGQCTKLVISQEAWDENLLTFTLLKQKRKTYVSNLQKSSFLTILPNRQCSIIFSINIPYPLLASCTNTCVTAPASLPSCIIGLPLTSESIQGQHFLCFLDHVLVHCI